MAPEKAKRKLTAILSADVKGYSRLIGEDEEGTIQTLNAYKGVMAGLIQHHRGRVVGTAGDSVLAEFASVVDAVRCAVEIQEDLRDRNKEVPEVRRMEFRIGVNLGDVVEEGEDILGDGVNIAARVQSLAEAGGICISGTVYDQIKGKLAFSYEYVGEQAVKNIKEPVRVYRVLMEAGVAKKEGGPRIKEKGSRRIILGIGVVVIAVAAVIGYLYLRPSPREIASKEKMAFSLPDKPSIAVLPFVNMSKDPDQEYFSDGMTEDLITDLSKISGLLVIARNSTFTYKGKPVKVKQVAEELGVRYVLEGSVRRAGDEIRINAQLIDALTGHHLWAERYDGTMSKIFALQDQITQKIVSALAVKLTGTEKQTIAQKGTNNIEAYDEFLRGWGYYLRMTPGDITKAIKSFKRATELDSSYSRAYAGLALAYWAGGYISGLGKELGIQVGEARLRVAQYVKEAMKNPTATAHQVKGLMYLLRRQHEEAISELERALALDPNDPVCNREMGLVLSYSGKPKEAVDFINRGMRLDPHNPARYLILLGIAQFCMGNPEEAAGLLEKARRINPEYTGWAPWLASIYGLLGREKEGRAMLDTWEKVDWGIEPKLPFVMWIFPFRDRFVADRFAEGIVKAGIKGPSSGYFPVFKENQLTGEQIKRLLFASKITGIGIIDGQRWWADRRKNGELTLQGGSPITIDTGRSRVDGDLLCNQFEKRNWGLESCGTVFKNPKGTYEAKDEYISYFELGAFIPWSVER